ncbi:MAG: DUF4157 domain-containing protein [Candidatus Solibacter sp.]|nr:DUF4157 domain-containing protein [Candidatus Solibacter sp.]
MRTTLAVPQHTTSAPSAAWHPAPDPATRRRIREALAPRQSSIKAGAELEEAVECAKGAGRTLDGSILARMESAFGSEFRGVRVHTGPEAETLARGLNARAFTSGEDIFFRQGEYQPATGEGEKLLAHELAHVVQQKQGRVAAPQGKGGAVAEDKDLESEADRMSEQACAGMKVQRSGIATFRSSQVREILLQRQTAPGKARASESSDVKEQMCTVLAVEDVAGAWTYILAEQKDGVGEVWEDMRRPKKPSVEEDLLRLGLDVLLGATFGFIGIYAANAAEKYVSKLVVAKAAEASTGQFRGEGGGFISKAEGTAAIESAKLFAKAWGDFAKDAAKAAAKDVIGGQIKGIGQGSVPDSPGGKGGGKISSGRAADMFFGTMSQALNQAAKAASEAARKKGRELIAMPHGLQIAELEKQGLDVMFRRAKEDQKRAAVSSWLNYQAQADGRGVEESPQGRLGTNMSPGSDPLFFDTPGVLYVDCIPGGAPKVTGMRIKGSTDLVVSALKGRQLKSLQIPILVRFSYGKNDFSLRMNENGKVSWDRAAELYGEQIWLELGGGQLNMGREGRRYYSGDDAQLIKGMNVMMKGVIGELKVDDYLKANVSN